MAEAGRPRTPGETSVSERLAELGVVLPGRPATPAGSYVPAVKAGSLVFTAGQLPLVEGRLQATGEVGARVDPHAARACARTCAINALAAVAAVAGSLDSVAGVVKVTGYVASAPDFTAQAAVLDGASNLLADIFGTSGVHARSAVGVATLPLDAPVEVELVVEVG